MILRRVSFFYSWHLFSQKKWFLHIFAKIFAIIIVVTQRCPGQYSAQPSFRPLGGLFRPVKWASDRFRIFQDSLREDTHFKKIFLRRRNVRLSSLFNGQAFLETNMNVVSFFPPSNSIIVTILLNDLAKFVILLDEFTGHGSIVNSPQTLNQGNKIP